MQEVTDIFFDSSAQNHHFADDQLNLIYPYKGSVCNNISSLGDVFTEWYLFDSSQKKNIKKFLSTENLTDIFTETEFIDLMCGNACVDDIILQFIMIKLPFRITMDRLHILNQYATSQYNDTYAIKSKSNLTDKICELYRLKKQEQKEKYKKNRKANKEHIRLIKHDYYLRNKEYIQKIKHEHYLKNQERIKQHSQEYYLANKDRIREYYAKNKEQRQKLHREYYEKNKELVRERNHEYRNIHRKEQNQYSKEYYIAHREEQKQYQKEYYEKSQQNKAIAKTICATYLFLLKFKKENKDEYLKTYKKRHDPLHSMFKTCVALQNNDIKLCPFCNENCKNTIDKCCNQKILSIPNATIEIQSIANTLKQR